MKAVILDRYGDDIDEVLRFDEIAAPEMRPNDVLVEIHAAAFNPYDCKIRRGWLQGFYPLQPPHVLGTDFAGVIVDRGSEVVGLDVGDKVYGLQETMRSGSYAELTAINYMLARRMPANLSFIEAASIPMTAMTSWFALVELGEIRAGSRVLIHGAGGGVGSTAVQLAKAMGCWVAATCSEKHVAFVRELGADQVIDYGREDFAEVVKDIDVALDPIGGEVNQRTYGVLRRGGVMLVVLRADPVEIANREPMSKKFGISVREVAFENRPDTLDKVRPLYESGVMRPLVSDVLPLAHAAQAHHRSEQGHLQGKLMLKVRD